MINILGVNISALKKEEVLKKIELFLSEQKQHYIVTPNPEIILEAQKDEEFFYILNKADLAIPDGVGLKFAGWVLRKNLCRITGASLTKDILKIAKDNNLKVAVLNWSGGLSKRDDIEKTLKEKYPGLNFLVKDIERKGAKLPTGSLAPFQSFKPSILFATLGAPWQEKFIYHNLGKLPFVKIAIGIGGSFDFLTGKIKRAPRFMRILGIEWLWRLFKQPWRWKRIWRAVVVFPWEFIKWKFIKLFFYRLNVVCFLYKKEEDGYKVLIVERKEEESGHWQIPQGGMDGENIKKAGQRELEEEVGTDKFKIISIHKNIYKYKFNQKAKQRWGYKGQKQNLMIAKFVGKDSNIKICPWELQNWKWVDADSLVDAVHPIRKAGAKIFLEKFKSLRITN